MLPIRLPEALLFTDEVNLHNRNAAIVPHVSRCVFLLRSNDGQTSLQVEEH